MAKIELNTQIQLRHDTAANWTTANPVLLNGEPGIETDTGKIKFGDGSTAWNDLDYNFQVDLNELVMSSDITATYTFGKYSPDSSGSVTIPAAGKTIEAFLQDALAEEKDPTVTQPSASVTLTNAGAKEVGTTLVPAYTTSFNQGNYSYGPDDTGVTVTSYNVTDGVTGHDAVTTASGSFPSLTVTDGISYRLSATITYSAGVNPLTNLGNEAADLAIAAGSKTVTSSAITGYRQAFYGSVTDKTGDITSDVIRGLSGKSGKAVTKGGSLTASEAVGAMRVIIAVPASVATEFSSIKDVNGLNAETISAWTKITVAVEGANSYDAVDYTVYYKDNAAANDTANTWAVTI